MRRLNVLLLLSSCMLASAASAQHLRGDELRAAISGYTVSGKEWAEFYAPNGRISGRARYFGMVRNYVGRWTAHDDRICYAYENSSFDTCSRLELRENLLYHYSLDGRLKADGVGRRIEGNTLQ